MKRITGLAAGAAAVIAMAVSVPGVSATGAVDAGKGTEHAQKVRKLSGSVGPSFTISMNRSSTRAGVYDITVVDNSSMHNFHFKGPGVDKKTKVRFVGTKVWHVRLKEGRYTFNCDVHPDTMNGRLRVTARP